MKFYGFHTLSPEENMKIDEELLKAVDEGIIEPTFRIYGWSELCVSIGKHQEARKFPVKVVRRPTGGGALLHGWDISFAVVDYKEKWGKTPLEVYRKLSLLFVELFKNRGIDLKIEKNKSYRLDTYFCFFFPTFGELKTADGRKLVSIAMTERRNAFLAHGSVYVTFDYDEASHILGIEKEVLKNRVACLSEFGLSVETFRKLLYSYLTF